MILASCKVGVMSDHYRPKLNSPNNFYCKPPLTNRIHL